MVGLFLERGGGRIQFVCLFGRDFSGSGTYVSMVREIIGRED